MLIGSRFIFAFFDMTAPFAKIWDVLQVRFVFNYDVPREAEDYIHRAPLGRKRKRSLIHIVSLCVYVFMICIEDR